MIVSSFACRDLDPSGVKICLHTFFKVDTELKIDFRRKIHSLQGRLSQGIGYAEVKYEGIH